MCGYRPFHKTLPISSAFATEFRQGFMKLTIYKNELSILEYFLIDIKYFEINWASKSIKFFEDFNFFLKVNL